MVPVAHFQEQTVQVVKVTPPEGPAERMVEIVEEILKVVQTFLQERPLVFERIMKESSGVARSVPQECVQRTVEQVVNVPVLQIKERIVHVGK